MKQVLMPALGVTMAEGLLLRWFKQPGEAVAEGEVIAELETDKTTLEISSPAAGVLTDHRYAVGDLVPPGTVLTEIRESDDDEPLGGGRIAATSEPAIVAEDTPSSAELSASADVESATPDVRDRHRQSPRQRRMAAEARATRPADRSIWEAGRHRPVIAAKVTESWRTIPHFAVIREVDATIVSEVRSLLPAELRVTVTDILLRAIALTVSDTGHGGPVDVGLAVATPDGVMVPVLRDILQLDPAALAERRLSAVERAFSGRLETADIDPAPPITLSNLGSKGVDLFTGVIALGQPLLLTVGRIALRAVVADGAIVSRATFFATLNVDHRLFDGEPAAQFLAAFADVCRDPARLQGLG